MAIELHDAINDVPVEVLPSHLTVAGFTGRSEDEVERHARELRSLGVSVPHRLPTYYPVKPTLLTGPRSDALSVPSTHVTGEVEPVLLKARGQWYVGVGSDLTHREVERSSISASKDMCPKPVGGSLWPLDDVVDRWDELRIRGFEGAGPGGESTQDATLAALLAPLDILTRGGLDATSAPEGTVVFCGTVPRSAPYSFAPWFRGELIDDCTGRMLFVEYRVTAPDLFHATPPILHPPP